MTLDLVQLGFRLRGAALALPETHEDHPWGECAFKVRGKVFLFMNASGDSISLSAKLPISGEFALHFDWTAPTGYGLGKAGWVSARLAPDTEADPDLIERWLLESYRAVAPKRLAALVAPVP